MDLLYPSIEIQLADLERQGAVPSLKILKETYKTKTLNALKKEYSGNEFVVRGNGVYQVRKGKLFKKYVKPAI